MRWLLALTVLIPIDGHAAPFCLTNEGGIPPQCIYFDANSCRKESARQGGYCSVNVDEVKIGSTLGKYCLVTSQLAAVCGYLDREACDTAASRQGGACVNTPAGATGAPDPFQLR